MTTADPPPLGHVVIGPRDIYDQLVRLTGEVTTLAGRVERLADGSAVTDQRLEAHADEDQRRLSDHEQRLRSVERRGWALAGAAAVVGMVGGTGAAQLLGGG